MPKLIDRLPAALANRLRTKFGTQFVRFAAVAAVSLVSSQIVLAILIELHVTGGISGVSAGITGSIVSYFLSRKAWGRKGKPSLLRETIPFWMVSIGAWLVLGLATKLGLRIAVSLDARHFKEHLIVGGVYFLANCLTFVIRFLIFHYLLFADRSSKADVPAGPIETESLSPVTVPASSDEENKPAQ